ncbi:MAG: DinB family protein [Bacteroidota bacterium]
MAIEISTERQFRRIKKLQNALMNLRKCTWEDLQKKTNSKSWSVIEIIDHMIIAQEVYRPKINKALNREYDSLQKKTKSKGIPAFLIKRFPPQKDKIRLKMKTSKIFRPHVSNVDLENGDGLNYIDKMDSSLRELNDWCSASEKADLSYKFNSAIGPIVRFNVMEACEFILCHNERHFQQIKNVLRHS